MFCTGPRLTHTLPMPDFIQGVTTLLDKLYVLHMRDADHLDEYTISDAEEYVMLRGISVPGLPKNGVCDIVSCEQNKCLYLSNMRKAQIHIVVPKSTTRKFSKWTLSEVPYGLSVTDAGNLLVTCLKSRRLLELNPHGKCIRTIALNPELHAPIHSVQLASGNFVVCCFGGTGIHRVCNINPQGKVEQSYGGVSGGGEGRLSSPTHVAVDKDGFVFVADGGNARIVMLSPSLRFVTVVLPNELQQQTNHVYIDSVASRLYASSRMISTIRATVSVVQL